uniref:Uncharacterized protein n=1 Tax=Nonomuraea gerenzanensis TaxID=93944 RepID=A0A1M4EAM6_9ACTN|nr:hypothetical protein [Nonomuraea gerenzanensis]SBO95870.1 hypothetical protein BN4615_P5386 [Nonomuraea gerenzanensis]
MASMPAGSWSATGVDEVVDCLGGAVHLAYAEAASERAGERAGEVAAIVAGFSGHEARTRARARARASAVRALRELAGARCASWPSGRPRARGRAAARSCGWTTSSPTRPRVRASCCPAWAC